MRLNKTIKYVLPVIFILTTVSIKGQLNDNYLKACASLERGDFSAAIDLFSDVISSSNNDLQSLIKRGETYSNTGNYVDAIKDLLQVAKYDSGKAAIYLARFYSLNSNVKESVKWLEIHLSSEYKIEKSRILTDKAFVNISDSAEWRRIWSKSWYSHMEEQLAEAAYLLRQKREYEALELLEKLVEHDDSGHGYYLRSLVNSEMGFDRKAMSDLEKAIKLDSDNFDFNNLMVGLLIKKGKQKEALQYYNIIINNQPENFNIRKKIVNLCIGSGNYSRAQNDLELLIDLFPNDQETIVLYGTMLFKSGKNQDAIQYYTRAIIQQPVNSSLYTGRALVHHKMKNYSKAISDYSMALDISPRDPDTWFGRANSRFSNGNSSGACSDWRKAVMYGHREALNMLDRYCK